MNETNENKEIMTCPHCGKVISAGTKTCPYCKKEIEVIVELPEGNDSRFTKIMTKIKKNKISAIILLISLIIAGISTGITLDQRSDYNALQNRYQSSLSRISELSSEINSLNEKYDSLISEHNELQTNYDNTTKEIENYKDQQATIDDLNKKVTELQGQYDSLQADRDNLQQQLDAKKLAQEQAARAAQEQQLAQQAQQAEGTVYWTPNGDCYHSTPNCATLKRSSNITSGSISSAGGRRPCKVCH